MRKRMIAVSGLALLFCGAAAQAEVLGQRLLGVQAGIIKPEDEMVKVVDDTIITYGLFGQIPVHANIDLVASINRSTLDGEFEGVSLEVTDTTASGGVRAHLAPGKLLNPFVGAAVIYSRIELDADGGDLGDVGESESDTGYSLSGGVELNLTESFSLLGSITRFDVHDEDGNVVSVAASFWISPQFAVGAAVSQDLDDDHRGYTGSLAFRF
jgi:opacity protein-like surface antigen